MQIVSKKIIKNQISNLNTVKNYPQALPPG